MPEMVESDKTAVETGPHAVSYPKPRNPLRRLYNWVLHWAETPYGVPALFILAFVESSFFPIPPDILLIALALSIPAKAFRYALVCTAGSLTGAVLGYTIGFQFWSLVGEGIVRFYNAQPEIDKVMGYYEQNAFLWVWLAGFTPIPYKVFTIAAGIFERERGLGMFARGFWIMMGASACSRTLRFFLVGGLIWKFGKPIAAFIHKYFNLMTIILAVLILLGVVVMKYVI